MQHPLNCLGSDYQEALVLLLKCPPPQHSKTLPIRWVGASILLHGLLLLCALGVASIISVYVPAQSGSAITVSLVGMGSTAAGDNTPQLQVESSQTSAMQASAAKEPTVMEEVSPTVQPEPQAAVPLKRKDSKPKSVAKPAVEKAEFTPKPNASAPQPLAQPADTAVAVQGSGGKSSVNSGSGLAEQALGSTKGEASPQMQAVAWNAPGGPGFVRQGPLRYPRAAQRHNLEGKAIVEAYLDMQGKLVRARVLQADHEDFGDAALACIQASSFKPAQRDGKAVPCVVRIPMLFVLKGM